MLVTHPLHEKAKNLVTQYLKLESELIECLQAIQKNRVFEMLGYTSLFKYAVDALKLSKSQAYTLISVARKSEQVLELKTAIQSGALSVSKARKIVSVITPENSEQWIQKAIELPQQKLEREVAKENPMVLVTERLKPVAENRIELKCGISEELEGKLKRVQELLSSSLHAPCTLEQALEAMTESFLERKDPLRIAQRTQVKEAAQAGIRIPESLRRQALKRDQAQCCHREPSGKRCSNRHWVQVHHRTPQSEGGGHTLENLVTLCSAHHQMHHDHEGRGFKNIKNSMQGSFAYCS